MLHVIIMIGKAVILLILGLLGLILALGLLVLISAVRYRLTASCHETGQLELRISWLFGLVRYRYRLEAGETASRLTVFGFHPGGRDDSRSEDYGDERRELQPDEEWSWEEPEDWQEREEGWVESEDIREERVRRRGQRERTGKRKRRKRERELEFASEEPQPVDKTKKKRKKKKKKRPHPYETQEESWDLEDEDQESEERTEASGHSLWTRLRENGSWIREFIDQPSVRKLIRKILRKNRRLWRHILPRKVKADVRFGLGDPALTGEALAVMSMFYALYYRSVNLEPDFDEIVLEGDARISGHIRPGYLAWLALQIGLSVFFNKEVREFYRQARERSLL